MPRGAPPGGGTSRRSTPAAGAAPRGDRHRLRRRLLPRSRTYRYRLACDPAGPWGGSLSGTWTGIQCRSSGDRTCTATISLLRSARLPPIGWGAPRTFEVLYLEPVTCLPRRERQRQELLGRRRSPRRFGRFSARRWRYTALRTGWTRSLWVAGDLEVSYEGLYELAAYEPGQSGPFPR